MARGALSRRRNIFLLYALAGLLTTSHGSMELSYPLNLHRLGNALPLIGFSVGLMSFGALLSRLPGGAWYRLGQGRLLIAGSLAAMGLATIGLSVNGALILQALLAGIHGAAFGMASTFMLALLIDESAGPRSAAPTMAWYTAAVSTGYAAGYSLAGQLLQHLGYGPAFWASGLVGLAAAGLALAIQPASQERVREAGPPPGMLAALKAIPRLPLAVWLAALLVFYINFLSDSLGAFFPIYAVGIGISLAAVGYIKSVNSLAATAIRFTAAGVLRFLNVGVVNHASVLAMAAAVVAVSIVTNQYFLAVLFGILGVSRGLIRVTSATMIADQRERLGSRVGMASGLYNAGLDLGSMLAPPVTGGLAALIGIPVTFRVVAVALPILYYGAWLRQRARLVSRSAVEARA